MNSTIDNNTTIVVYETTKGKFAGGFMLVLSIVSLLLNLLALKCLLHCRKILLQIKMIVYSQITIDILSSLINIVRSVFLLFFTRIVSSNSFLCIFMNVSLLNAVMWISTSMATFFNLDMMLGLYFINWYRNNVTNQNTLIRCIITWLITLALFFGISFEAKMHDSTPMNEIEVTKFKCQYIIHTHVAPVCIIVMVMFYFICYILMFLSFPSRVFKTEEGGCTSQRS